MLCNLYIPDLPENSPSPDNRQSAHQRSPPSSSRASSRQHLEQVGLMITPSFHFPLLRLLAICADLEVGFKGFRFDALEGRSQHHGASRRKGGEGVYFVLMLSDISISALTAN